MLYRRRRGSIRSILVASPLAIFIPIFVAAPAGRDQLERHLRYPYFSFWLYGYPRPTALSDETTTDLSGSMNGRATLSQVAGICAPTFYHRCSRDVHGFSGTRVGREVLFSFLINLCIFNALCWSWWLKSKHCSLPHQGGGQSRVAANFGVSPTFIPTFRFPDSSVGYHNDTRLQTGERRRWRSDRSVGP